MDEAPAGRPRRANTRSLGLLAASLLFLVGGALLAVSLEGPARLLLAAISFAGYLFFSSGAFRDLFPGLLGEGDPDPERAGEPSPGRERTHLTAA
ncbi:MAG: hypothetical protein NEA02_18450 [Thermoanaerobaculia bacterium]|nr:hypothetical protein [Thermoanaerobaculia bacterium]